MREITAGLLLCKSGTVPCASAATKYATTVFMIQVSPLSALFIGLMTINAIHNNSGLMWNVGRRKRSVYVSTFQGARRPRGPQLTTTSLPPSGRGGFNLGVRNVRNKYRGMNMQLCEFCARVYYSY